MKLLPDNELQLNLIKMVEEKWKIPEPHVDWKVKLEALTESKLKKQLSRCIHQMRISQAEMMFYHFNDVLEAATVLMGEKPTNSIKGDRKEYNFTFLHHENKESPTKWGEESYFHVKNKPNHWFLPPFKPVEIWRVVRHLDLDELTNPIPLDVILAINWLRSLHFFNAFSMLESGNKVMILAELWSLDPVNDRPATESGDVQLFLISKYTTKNKKE